MGDPCLWAFHRSQRPAVRCRLDRLKRCVVRSILWSRDSEESFGSINLKDTSSLSETETASDHQICSCNKSSSPQNRFEAAAQILAEAQAAKAAKAFRAPGFQQSLVLNFEPFLVLVLH